MSVWEIILIIGYSLFVTSVIVSYIVKRIKGKPTCDCGCNCSHCSGCYHAKRKKSNKND